MCQGFNYAVGGQFGQCKMSVARPSKQALNGERQLAVSGNASDHTGIGAGP